jgi:transcriptional regulator with XRE-family HTH domain
VDDELVGLTTGERIKHFRTRAGMSRAVLGGLVERSAEWVKAVETNRLLTPRLPVLLRLARALDITDLARLTGNGVAVPVEVFAGTAHSALGAVRSALTGYHLDDTAATAVDPRHVRARLDLAWKVRHSSPDHRTAVGAVLPALIRDAQQSVRRSTGPLRREARRTLAGVYQLADFFVAYQPAPELVWLVADRSITEAQAADDPYLMAGGAWALTQVLRDAGRWDEAIAVSTDGVGQLEPRLAEGSADLRAMCGALLFETGYVHARRGKHGMAWSFWDRANKIAELLPVNYRHTQTSFGRAVLVAHAVTLDVELRRSGEAAARARRFDANAISSIARRSRHLVEVARAHHQQGDHAGTYATLRSAADTAPETVRFNGYAKDMASTLLASPPTGMAQESRRLAADIGITHGP